MTSLRRKSILVLAGAIIGVAVVPSSSLATHDVVRARRVAGDFRWRDSETASAQTHLLNTPHRLKWRNPSNGVRHDVTFYREPAGVNIRNIGSLAPGETKSRRIPNANGIDYYKYRCTIHSGFDQEGRCRGMCGRITAH